MAQETQESNNAELKPRIFFATCFNPARDQFEVHKVELKPGELSGAYMDDLQRKENEAKSGKTAWVPIEADTEEERLVLALGAGRLWQARENGQWDNEDK